MDHAEISTPDQPTPRPGLTFPDASRLALDDLLGQLVERAQDVMASQGRLRGLLRANQMVVADLSSADVLKRIVEAAVELVGARFGALGVLGPTGNMEQFITVGIDQGDIDRIGQLPEGAGILGVLTDRPEPIRLDQISADGRSVGFPPNHPPMNSFLGVPIRVRGEVFGNLYLTEREGGRFTHEDEELAVALAASAAIAIENARLYAEAHKRHEWLTASAEITRELLAATDDDALHTIAARAMQVADADQVAIVLPLDDDTLCYEVTLGDASEQLHLMRISAKDSLVALCLASGASQAIDDLAQDDRRSTATPTFGLGPALIVPFEGDQVGRSGLVLMRNSGRGVFSVADVEMASTFADHAAMALQLAAGRQDRERLALLEDRGRIARDLHDHVIQRLFATGLGLQGISTKVEPAELGDRIVDHVSELDETIRQIRTTIFHLQESEVDPRSLRSKLLDVAHQTAKILGFDPILGFDGPLDTLVDAQLGEDVVAVVRETLSNVVRHAHAKLVQVLVSATSLELHLEVIDDGVGIGEIRAASGLANLRHRAERRGGTFEVGSAEGGGCRVSWSVPIPLAQG